MPRLSRWPCLLPSSPRVRAAGPDLPCDEPAWQAGRMQRWAGPLDVPDCGGRSVVTIGVFDGVHRGHQRIVTRAMESARELGLPVVVVTFDPHPDEVVRPGSHPPLLCTPRRESELLAGLGVDAVLVIPFTLEFSRLGPGGFGHKAAGDVALLAELGEKYDFTAEGVPLLTENGVTISSTGIRAMLTAGDVVAAAHALGRPHRVEGVVVRGHQRGRALGFPTANLETLPHTATPADGVYAGTLISLTPDGAEPPRCPAATSIGATPPFAATDRTIEAYALDRDDLDLYGTHAAIEFTARLRDNERFDSVEALVTQMREDVSRARTLTAGGRRSRPRAPPPPRRPPRRTVTPRPA